MQHLMSKIEEAEQMIIHKIETEKDLKKMLMLIEAYNEVCKFKKNIMEHMQHNPQMKSNPY